MNGSFPYTSSWVGSLGEYSIYEYLNQISSNTSNYTTNTSNILESHIQSQIYNTSNYIFNTSNILQTQITNTSNLIHKDAHSNTVIRISATNENGGIFGSPVEMLFHTVDGDCNTKINEDGELMVYHPIAPLPAGFSPGWWGVENRIANVIIDTQGLRFDVTNLQAATATTAITNSSAATAAVAGAAAGAATATATTAAVGATIAGGDYGTVALGVAGGALFSVLGYLSYQGRIKSNLEEAGFTDEAAQVEDNMNTANVLITENIKNIALAKGFINSNITTQQLIPSLRTSNLNLISGDISSVNFINASNANFSNLNVNSNLIIGSNLTIAGDISYVNFINASNANFSNLNINSNLTIGSNLTIAGNIFNANSIIGTTASFNTVVLNNYVSASGSIILKLPSTNFVYDSLNNFYVYDLNIQPYIPFKLIQQNPTLFIKTRIFQITSIMSTNFQDLEKTNLNNLTGNAICFPETLTIYMSNDKLVNSQHIAAENYCNGAVYGRQNMNINGGYWNIVTENFDYIRLITGVGFTTHIMLQPILF